MKLITKSIIVILCFMSGILAFFQVVGHAINPDLYVQSANEFARFVFFNPVFGIVNFLIFTGTLCNIGYNFGVDVVDSNKQSCYNELDTKTKRLIEFINFARTLVVDDVDEHITKFVQEARQRYKLEENKINKENPNENDDHNQRVEQENGSGSKGKG